MEPKQQTTSGLLWYRLGLVAFIGFCGSLVSFADNVLVNPSFELTGGHVVPLGWTYFRPPASAPANYWVDSTLPAADGLRYWRHWGVLSSNNVNNVSGIYQDVVVVPGAVFNASGWFQTPLTNAMGPDCRMWMQIEFYSSGNLLAVFTSTQV